MMPLAKRERSQASIKLILAEIAPIQFSKKNEIKLDFNWRHRIQKCETELATCVPFDDVQLSPSSYRRRHRSLVAGSDVENGGQNQRRRGRSIRGRSPTRKQRARNNSD